MKEVLRVENLKQHFKVPGARHKRVYAVDGVSFSIEGGKTLGLVGESGCGKSTCARSIIRIYDPTEGKVILDGVDITKMSQKALKPLRKNMQMIFQDPYASLNSRMTVRDIIAEPLRAHHPELNRSQTDEMVYEILDKVGLAQGHARRYSHEFSGGQRQRIGIARALILKPKVVLCDEPISALDVSIQAQVVNLLKDFQNQLGLAYLFIAHDLSMVRYISDTVGVMYLGQLVEMCESEEIYANPLHPYTQGLLASVPIPDPAVARNKKGGGIEGDVASPINPPSGCRFHTRCKHAMPRCSEEVPQLFEAAPGHFVSCHLYS
ncbi:MAG: ATP-binding cassette domain-containing protein [Defluviitaleaceae bacterium]|nr:ATP-binding cassette domain-containing protein [Defluviitaleaceae bacterium]